MHNIPILLLAAVGFSGSQAMVRTAGKDGAAADSVLLRNSAYVTDADPWLPDGNAAALTRWRSDNLSWATLRADYGYGGFVNYNESSRESARRGRRALRLSAVETHRWLRPHQL